MALQTSIAPVMRAAFPGQWYDLTDTEAMGRTAQGSAIPFGVAVVQGGHNNQCMLPDNGDRLGNGGTTENDNKFLGISMLVATKLARSRNPAFVTGNAGAFYEPTESVSVATQGRVWCVTETACQPGDPVFFRHTIDDEETQRLGQFLNNDAGGNATEVAGASWMYASAAGEQSVVQLTGAQQANRSAATGRPEPEAATRAQTNETASGADVPDGNEDPQGDGEAAGGGRNSGSTDPEPEPDANP